MRREVAVMTRERPGAAGWPDRELYPFAPHYLEVGAGRIHYLDEGGGEPIVFVHGTPTWSFLWRDLIRELRGEYRCVAPDHLGFGLSDKPRAAAPARPTNGYPHGALPSGGNQSGTPSPEGRPNHTPPRDGHPTATPPAWDGTPRAHAENLARLIGHLGLRDVTLVVHDFGGPIGLAYALAHPENVRRVVLMNTWLWSNEGNGAVEGASRLLGGPIGRFLYTRLNFSARVLLRSAYADKRKLTPEVHRHYLAPFAEPAERLAPWLLARELTGSNEWYESLWRRRDLLAGKPMLIAWGLADRLITAPQLRRWQEAFPDAEVVPLEGVGHFVTEEAPARVTRAVREFLARDGSPSSPTAGSPP